MQSTQSRKGHGVISAVIRYSYSTQYYALGSKINIRPLIPLVAFEKGTQPTVNRVNLSASGYLTDKEFKLTREGGNDHVQLGNNRHKGIVVRCQSVH